MNTNECTLNGFENHDVIYCLLDREEVMGFRVFGQMQEPVLYHNSIHKSWYIVSCCRTCSTTDEQVDTPRCMSMYAGALQRSTISSCVTLLGREDGSVIHGDAKLQFRNIEGTPESTDIWTTINERSSSVFIANVHCFSECRHGPDAHKPTPIVPSWQLQLSSTASEKVLRWKRSASTAGTREL